MAEVRHLKVDTSMPASDKAMGLLEKCRSSIQPILASKQFGIDQLEEITPNMNKQSSNVLGFCLTPPRRRGNFQCTTLIALRLRDGKGAFYSWIEIMGTLLHEVTHIAEANHNSSFYKYLAKVVEEWETTIMQMPAGSLLDPEGNPTGRGIDLKGDFAGAFTGRGRRLGGKSWCGCNPTREELAGLAAASAEKRVQVQERDDFSRALAASRNFIAVEQRRQREQADLDRAIALSRLTAAGSERRSLSEPPEFHADRKRARVLEQMDLDRAIALSLSTS